MDSPSDTSFVRQSLTATLTATARPSKQPLRSTQLANPSTRPPNVRAPSTVTKAPAAKDAKGAAPDASGLLRALGLNKQSGATDEAWGEEPQDDVSLVGEGFATPKPRSQLPTSKSRPRLPAGPEDFSSSSSATFDFCALPAEDTSASLLDGLKKKLTEVERERDEYAAKCKRLEKELADVKTSNGQSSDGRVLGPREYEELERQFDAQERVSPVLLLPIESLRLTRPQLLSGYQRENERSMVETASLNRKVAVMSQALAKVYGPDWESTVGLGDGVVKGPPSPTRRTSLVPSPSTAGLASEPSASLALPEAQSRDKLASQLEQVHALVRAMERRLIQSEGELEEIRREAREEKRNVDKTVEGVRSMLADST